MNNIRTLVGGREAGDGDNRQNVEGTVSRPSAGGYQNLLDYLNLRDHLSAVRFPSAVARASSPPNPPLLLMVIHIQIDIHMQ